MNDLDYPSLMSDEAEVAVEVAAVRYGVRLDYTEGSVQAVEALLDRVARARRKGLLGRLFRRGPTDKDLWAHALVFGAYLGEVMRRMWGGEWQAPRPEIGEEYVTFNYGETYVWPTAKAYKRLLNGDEDNVWFYYRVLKAESPLRKPSSEADSDSGGA